MPIDNEVRQVYLPDFILRYGKRYAIIRELGEGHYGVTFYATDLHRDIPVCIKIYKQGIPPSGASRDWHITSALKSPLIAETYTIEMFRSNAKNRECIAVVSQYIPGSNLAQLLEKYEQIDQKYKKSIQDILSRQIGIGLCRAVNICHDRGYGHGDLHEKNVIVAFKDEGMNGIMEPVLVDFDNATYCRSLESESLRMASDIRLLRRLIGCLTYGSYWHDKLQVWLTSCTTVMQFQNIFSSALNFVGGVNNADPEYFTIEHIANNLRKLFAISLMDRDESLRIRNIQEEIISEMGVKKNYDMAQQLLIDKIKAREYPKEASEFIVTDPEEQAVLRSLI